MELNEIIEVTVSTLSETRYKKMRVEGGYFYSFYDYKSEAFGDWIFVKSEK